MTLQSKRSLHVILFFFVLCAAGTLLFIYLARNKVSPAVRVTGIIDGVEVNLSPKVAGRISWTACDEGDDVKKGQTVIRLDSEDFTASVRQAEAGVRKAAADVKTADASVRSAEANMKSAAADAESARADIERAAAQMDESRKEMERAKKLCAKEYISRESLDQAVAAYDVNAASHKAAQEQLKAALQRKNASDAGLKASESRLDSSKAALREAAANLDYYRAKLGDTVIKSPVSGTVIFKSMETGETVSPGVTIMTVVDLDSLYARVDIDETRISGIVLNSPAFVRVDGMSGKVFRGRVIEIGRYAEFATQRDVVRGREDIKTFRVKVKIDDTEGLLKPGMTVEVEIPEKT
ncbi:MAG: efflux RND transporter periplasmic adaptor subunit [Candidatus Sulfobium sp.]|jgi:HlyD family secretion protein